MAPVIEAFFATRFRETGRLNEPVSVRATARDRYNDARGLLRQRGRRAPHRSEDEHENLLVRDGGTRTPTDRGGKDSLDIPEYEMTQHHRSRTSTPAEAAVPATIRSEQVRSSSGSRPHDDEIRSIIFNTPPPPRPTSRASAGVAGASAETSGLILTGAGSTVLIPDIVHPPSEPESEGRSPRHMDPSTTFSFLSLSQVSSPEVPDTNLEAMSFSQFDIGPRIDQYENHNDANDERRDARDEVVSLPETTMSGYGYGYESAEMISAMSSPRYMGQSTPNIVGAAGVGGGGVGGVLGLNTVGDVGMSYISQPSFRRSRSVISLSESEGGSASDWEALSEARAGSS